MDGDEITKSQVHGVMRKLGIEFHKHEPYCLTQTELDQIMIYCKSIRGGQSQQQANKIRKKVHQLLAQASLKHHLGKLEKVKQIGHPLIDAYHAHY